MILLTKSTSNYMLIYYTLAISVSIDCSILKFVSRRKYLVNFMIRLNKLYKIVPTCINYLK